MLLRLGKIIKKYSYSEIVPPALFAHKYPDTDQKLLYIGIFFLFVTEIITHNIDMIDISGTLSYMKTFNVVYSS